ncbi:MAG: 1-acyl-sn-glycerol-3-phosphate acyltransferase [Bacilli bacterium]|nr:1-acyl-sn-glycerol-3-phosphate acyltransferase [Bacilli bacterium]
MGYKFFRGLLGPLFRLWYNPKIIGKENLNTSGPIIIAGNHKHVYDQCLIIISTKRVIHYMAKKEYFEGKLAWFFKAVGCIPVNREIKDITATNRALNVLNSGGAIGIFPEGTRNKTDKFLLDFKFGAVSMAKKTGATIIPFGLTGDYKFRSKNLVARVGKPFKVDNMDLEKANHKLYYEIKKLMEENLKTEK